MKAIASVFLIFVSSLALAADIPSEILGEERLNNNNCESTTTDNCINNQCLTSDDRDCQSECESLAKDKCARKEDQ